MKRNDKLKNINKPESENAVGLKHGLAVFFNKIFFRKRDKIFWCNDHDGSRPGILGLNFVEAKDKEEAKAILDKILIKRGSKPFSELPYKIIDFGYADKAKENIGELFYNGIIWES